MRRFIRNVFYDCRYDYIRTGWVVAAIIGGIIALVLGGTIGAIALDRHFSESGCFNYGEQTYRNVKWVDASFFDYDCYVLWDGNWVPKDEITRLTLGREDNVISEVVGG